jgi:hypothetical protein
VKSATPVKAPSSQIVSEALVVSCAVCALPSGVMSLGQRSWEPLFVFMVMSILHGMLLGLPAFWFLVWRRAVNAVSCAIAGTMVGTLPYLIVFAPRMSGPGVNHFRMAFVLALSGAAIGFVFWLYVTKRTGNAPE